MNNSDMAAAVKKQMPAHRWEHTVGVIDTAKKLAVRFGASVEKAALAALLHDVAKYWPAETLKQTLRQHGADEWLAYDEPLWHAPVGAIIAREQFGLTDPDVLNAIRYHTSGREQMSQLEKIVCLADVIEPGRNFPGIARIRQLAEHDLNQALIASFDATIRFLIARGKVIIPLTIMARNDLIKYDQKSKNDKNDAGGNS